MSSSRYAIDGLTKPWRTTSSGSFKKISRKKMRTEILDKVAALTSTLKLTGFYGLQSCELKLDTLDTSDVELGRTFAEELPTEGLVVKTYKELTDELSEWKQSRGLELDTIEKLHSQTLSDNWQEQVLNAAVVRHEDEPWEIVKEKIVEEKHKKAIATMREDKARSYIFANKVLKAGEMRRTYEIVKVSELIEISVELCERELESSIMNFVNNLENPAKRRPINSCTFVMSIKGDMRGECGSGLKVTSLLTMNKKTSFSRTWLTIQCNNIRGKKTGVTVTCETEVMMQQDKIVKTISSMVGHAGKISCSESDIQELTDEMWNKIIESGMIEMMEDTESFSPANYTDILPLMALAGAMPHEGDLNQVNSMWNDIINLIARKIGTNIDFIGKPELDDHMAKTMAVTISMSSYLKTMEDKVDFFIGALLWLKTCDSDIKQRDVISPAFSRRMSKDDIKTWSDKLGMAGQAVLCSLAFRGEEEADRVGYRYIPVYILINALTSSVYGIKRLRLGALVSSMLTYSVNREEEDAKMKVVLKDLGAEFGNEWSLRLALNPDIAWKIDCVSITMYDKVGPTVMSKTMKVLSFKDAVCVVSAVLTDDDSVSDMETTARENAAHLDEMRAKLASRMAMGGADDEASASKLISSIMSIVESAERTTRWLREGEECSDSAINIAEALVLKRKVIKEKDMKYNEEISSRVVSRSATASAQGSKFLDITTRSAIMARGICRITDDANLLEAMDKLYGPSSSCYIPIASYTKVDTGKHGDVETYMSTFAVTDPGRSIAGGALVIGKDNLASVIMASRDDSEGLGNINESRAVTFKIAEGAELTTSFRFRFNMKKFVSALRRISASTNYVSTGVVIEEIEDNAVVVGEVEGGERSASVSESEKEQSELTGLVSKMLPEGLKICAEEIVGSSSGDAITAIIGNFVNRTKELGVIGDFVEIKLVIAIPVFFLDATTFSLMMTLKLADYVWLMTSKVVNFLIGPEEDKEEQELGKNMIVDTVKIIAKLGAVSLSSSIIVGMLGFKSGAAYAIKMMLKISYKMSCIVAQQVKNHIDAADELLSNEIIEMSVKGKRSLIRRILIATHKKETEKIVDVLKDDGSAMRSQVVEKEINQLTDRTDMRQKMKKIKDQAIILSQISMRSTKLVINKSTETVRKLIGAAKKLMTVIGSGSRYAGSRLFKLVKGLRRIANKAKYGFLNLFKRKTADAVSAEERNPKEATEPKKKKSSRRRAKKTAGIRRGESWSQKIKSSSSDWIMSKIASELAKRRSSNSRVELKEKIEEQNAVVMLKMWSFKDRGEIEALIIAKILREDSAEDAYAIYGGERDERKTHELARLSNEEVIEIHYNHDELSNARRKAELAIKIVKCGSYEILSFDDDRSEQPRRVNRGTTGMRLSSMEDRSGRWSVIEVQSLDERGRRVFGWATKVEDNSGLGIVRIVSAEHLLSYGSRAWCHVDCDDIVTLATYRIEDAADNTLGISIDTSGEGVAEFKNWNDPKMKEFEILREAYMLEGSEDRFAMYQVKNNDMRGLSGGPITIEPLGDIAIILSQIEGEEFDWTDLDKRKVIVGARITEEKRPLVVIKKAKVVFCKECASKADKSPEAVNEKEDAQSVSNVAEQNYVGHPAEGEEVDMMSSEPNAKYTTEIKETKEDNEEETMKVSVEADKTEKTGRLYNLLGGALTIAKKVFLEDEGDKIKQCASAKPRNEFMIRSRIEAEQISVVADLAKASYEFGLGKMTRAIINSVLESIYEDKVLVFMCIDAATRIIVSSMLSVMEVEFRVAYSLVSLVDMLKWAGRSGRRWVIATDVKIIISQEMSFGRPVMMEASKIAKIVGIGVKQMNSEAAVSVLTSSCAMISHKFELHLYESEEDKTGNNISLQKDWDTADIEITEMMFISCVNGRMKMSEEDDSEIIVPQQHVKKMIILTDNYDSREQSNLSLEVTRVAKCTRDGVTVLGVSSLAGDVLAKWIKTTDMVAIVAGAEIVEDEYRKTLVMPLGETSTDARQCLKDVVNIYKAKMNIKGGDWSLNKKIDMMLTSACSAVARDRRSQYCYQLFYREQISEQVTMNLVAKRMIDCEIQGARIIEKATFKETVHEMMIKQGSNILELDRLENGLISEESERFAMQINDKRWKITQHIARVRKMAMVTAAVMTSSIKMKLRKVIKWAEKKASKCLSEITSFMPKTLKKVISWCVRKSRERNERMTKTSGDKQKEHGSGYIENVADSCIQISDSEDSNSSDEEDMDTDEVEEENERMKYQIDNYKLVMERWWTESKEDSNDSTSESQESETEERSGGVLTSVIKKTTFLAAATYEAIIGNSGEMIRKTKDKLINTIKKICERISLTYEKSKKFATKLAEKSSRAMQQVKSFACEKRKEMKCYNYREKENSETVTIWRVARELAKLMFVAIITEVKDNVNTSKRERIITKIMIGSAFCIAESIFLSSVKAVCEPLGKAAGKLIELTIGCAILVDFTARLMGNEVVLDLGIFELCLGKGGVEAAEEVLSKAMSVAEQVYNKKIKPAVKIKSNDYTKTIRKIDYKKRWGVVKTASLIRRATANDLKWDVFEFAQAGQILAKAYTWIKRRILNWSTRSMLKKIWQMISNRVEYKGPTGVLKLSKCHSRPQKTLLALSAGGMIIGVGMLAREVAATDAAVIGALAERKNTADNINSFMREAKVYARVTRIMTIAIGVAGATLGGGGNKLISLIATGATATEWATANADEVGLTYGILDVITKAAACGMSPKLVYSALSAWWCDSSDGSLAVSTIILTSGKERRRSTTRMLAERSEVMEKTVCPTLAERPDKREIEIFRLSRGINEKEKASLAELFNRSKTPMECIKSCLKTMRGKKGDSEVSELQALESQGKIDMEAGQEMVDLVEVANKTAMEEEISCSIGNETEGRSESKKLIMIEEVFCNQCKYVGKMNFRRETEDDRQRFESSQESVEAVFWSEKLWKNVIDVAERREWKPAGDKRLDVILALAERNDKPAVFPEDDDTILRYCVGLSRWLELNMISRIKEIDMRIGIPDWKVTVNSINRKATSGILTRARTGLTIAASYVPNYVNNIAGARLAIIANNLSLTAKMVNVFAKRRVEKVKMGSVVKRKYVITRTIQAHETDLKLAVADIFAIMDKTIKLTRNRTGIMVGMGMFKEFVQDDWKTKMRSKSVSEEEGREVLRVAIDHSSYDANQRLWAIEAVKEIRKNIVDKTITSRRKVEEAKKIIDNIYDDLKVKWFVTASGDVLLVSGQQMSGHATTSSDNSMRAMGYALECAEIIEQEEGITVIKESIRVQGDDTKFDLMINSNKRRMGKEGIEKAIEKAMKKMGQDVKQDKMEIKAADESCKFLSHYSERRFMIIAKVNGDAVTNYLATFEIPMRTREEIITMLATSLRSGTKRKTRREAQLIAAKAASFMIMYCGDVAIANISAIVLRIANALLSTFGQSKTRKLSVTLDKLPWLVRQGPILGEFSISMNEMLEIHGIGDEERGYYPKSWLVEQSLDNFKALQASLSLIENATKEMRNVKLEEDKALVQHKKMIEKAIKGELLTIEVSSIQELIISKNKLATMTITEGDVSYVPMNRLADKVKRNSNAFKDRGEKPIGRMVKLTNENGRKWNENSDVRREVEETILKGKMSEMRLIRLAESKEGIKMGLQSVKEIKSVKSKIITMTEHEDMMVMTDFSRDVENVIVAGEEIEMLMQIMIRNERSILRIEDVDNEQIPIEMISALEINDEDTRIKEEIEELEEIVEERDQVMKRYLYDLVETQVRNYVLLRR